MTVQSYRCIHDAVLRDSVCNIERRHRRQQVDSGIVACQVGRFGSPWYYLADTVCLLGFSCKYHGAHFRQLPMRLRKIEDSCIASAMSTWTRLATSSKYLTSTPPPPSQLQRVWDDQCCKIQAETLLDVATDHVVRARLLLLHALRGLATGSMHCPYRAQD